MSKKMTIDGNTAASHVAYAFSEVAEAGSFPSFASDVLLRQNGMPEGKKIVPILDPEVDVTYYLVCKTTDQKLFQPVFRRLHTIK